MPLPAPPPLALCLSRLRRVSGQPPKSRAMKRGRKFVPRASRSRAISPLLDPPNAPSHSRQRRDRNGSHKRVRRAARPRRGVAAPANCIFPPLPLSTLPRNLPLTWNQPGVDKDGTDRRPAGGSSVWVVDAVLVTASLSLSLSRERCLAGSRGGCAARERLWSDRNRSTSRRLRVVALSLSDEQPPLLRAVHSMEATCGTVLRPASGAGALSLGYLDAPS
ncbi:hypothetical protein GLOTRDRAFT_134632 [Gloeophyllum trabeum ATCC 11539]|uniref:Uncharacterized protein n=1 Tax=Gloeophyllum trabeum (strain ATCC 11539 / FP-39264 / Madison 617) TaxID=670483 RepID=S7PPH4_GLOTA|nr:uncharacterized protein GLOTRDRAFT_134632 [Gloeophyllum trabeum ATCC 11539]EPQ49771.1 hypothetical protein GLOTRDRAFT_134632 [Gloeophyllum trabeum ATCC 11539]